ncbi:hypothetical protein [Brevundimonas sp. Root1423]|uniref:hypothetical protein n=1 Tax=Brevundimonas sp. Root1423 TaxID=1736462 RepID=UPI0006F3E527|nr:hypothetical protein [Brevundimonas sp. Root1423]KQY89606.1 hypothetical protein ASD25_03300 [Brevundimonas sp. Root1423]
MLFALLFRQAGATIDPEDAVRRRAAFEWTRTWALAATTGVLSGLIALTPALRAAPWLPGVTYWLIPAGIGLFALIDRRRARAG